MPTLVISSALDMPDARVSAAHLASTIPGAVAHVFPNVAHLPSMECPAEFNALVTDFLRKS